MLIELLEQGGKLPQGQPADQIEERNGRVRGDLRGKRMLAFVAYEGDGDVVSGEVLNDRRVILRRPTPIGGAGTRMDD
jgi:hypothetical protein